jgi:hypothetical protein
MTPGGSFFVYPYRSEKEIKVYLDTFSCIYEHDQEAITSIVSLLCGKLVKKGNKGPRLFGWGKKLKEASQAVL